MMRAIESAILNGCGHMFVKSHEGIFQKSHSLNHHSLRTAKEVAHPNLFLSAMRILRSPPPLSLGTWHMLTSS